MATQNYPIGFDLQSFPGDRTPKRSSRNCAYLELDVPPFCSGKDGPKSKIYVPCFGAALIEFLSPLEAGLVGSSSNGFNTSRIKEAPLVPNGLRVAIQAIDYLHSRKAVCSQMRSIHQALDSLLEVRKDSYFLVKGCCVGLNVARSDLVRLEPPTCYDFSDERALLGSNYLVPCCFGAMKLEPALRAMMTPDAVPDKFSREAMTQLKNALYYLASTTLPRPVHSKMHIIYGGSPLATSLQVCNPKKEDLPIRVEITKHESGREEYGYYFPDHPKFVKRSLNVVLEPVPSAAPGQDSKEKSPDQSKPRQGSPRRTYAVPPDPMKHSFAGGCAKQTVIFDDHSSNGKCHKSRVI